MQNSACVRNVGGVEPHMLDNIVFCSTCFSCQFLFFAEPMDYIPSAITSLAVLELGQTIDSTETAPLTSSPPLTISSVSSASHTTQTNVSSSSTTMGCSTEPSVYIVSDPSSSTLAYTAGVGVVSVLLLLSLMGNVVYTIVVCTLLRKKMKYHYEFKK